jgi:hypothetical protein
MIEFAGLGVAMGNASEVIKAQGDFVTDTNMYDGVAKVFEEFVLKTIPVQQVQKISERHPPISGGCLSLDVEV